jgi:Restriction endonuclease
MAERKSKLKTGDDFRDRACALLRQAGFTVSVEVRVGHKKIDATAEKFEYGRLRKFGIECKAFAVSKPLSIKIVADYIGLKGRFVGEVWVIAKSFSPDARRHIDGVEGFRAISFEELQDIADKTEVDSGRQLLATPEVIKGMFEVLDHLKRGETSPDRGATDMIAKLRYVQRALEDFASDGLRLTAFTKLQAVTSAMAIDLREAFATISPDLSRSRRAHAEYLEVIERELAAVWETGRAGDHLAMLRDSPKLMQHLQRLPPYVEERLTGSPWDEYLWSQLTQASAETGNFANFIMHIRNVRTITVALNNYASHMISQEVEQFTATMEKLREALAAT